MATSSSLQANEAAAPADVSRSAPEKRSLLLVAGSGRSGTSLFTGILQRLGFYVPKPEVPADETNPRGFAESQWVVDFHTRMLKRAAVQVSDARPVAWSHVADLTVDDAVGDELRKWLNMQFKEADHLIIKDPRLSWFLPLWRRCAEELEVSPRFATVLRHPAAVIDSKQRSYGKWQGEVSRTAGWLNQTLFTERATRDSQRVFVRYEDLLDDWTSSVARVGDQLELQVIQDAPGSGGRPRPRLRGSQSEPLARHMGRLRHPHGPARTGRPDLGAPVAPRRGQVRRGRPRAVRRPACRLHRPLRGCRGDHTVLDCSF